MRKVEKKDFEILFEWVNNEDVIKNSKYRKGKSIEEFTEWFEERIKNKSAYMFVLEKENNYIGQINFEVINKESIINYSVDQKFRSKGFGKELVKCVQNYIHNNVDSVEKISAYVSSSNPASIRVFESLGFIREIIEKDFVKLIKLNNCSISII